jgi:hypothetical protein
MRGGKRPGAGRRKNVPNKASGARELAAQATGMTPADILLYAMRDFLQLASKTTNARKRSEHIRSAAAIARDAAPFFHARRAPTSPASPIDLPKTLDTLAEVDAAIQSLARAQAAGTIPPDQATALLATFESQRETIRDRTAVQILKQLEGRFQP